MLITHSNLELLINAIIKSAQKVIGPVKEDKITSYQPISSFNQVHLSLPFPTKSAKEYFLAESEPILSYRFGERGKVEVSEPAEAPELVLFGLRPCEAVSFPVMDQVHSWDYRDGFYLKRRDKNVIITVACEECDEFCFCTSVGVSPQATEGSDILLQKTKSGNYLVNVITDKGKKLMADYQNLFNESGTEELVDYKGPAKKFDNDQVRKWLQMNFEHPLWERITLPCIGCGICTFLCPTCHCFDIVDEANLKEGVRLKNWDGCQFAMFTVHASWHNPRETQAKRFRQRIQHKFNYYPAKFGRTLCVGCGRCIRHCPVDMSLLETVVTIDKLATV